MGPRVVVVVVVVVMVVMCGGMSEPVEDTPGEEAAVTTNTSQVFIKVMSTQCLQQYSLTCLKLDMVRLVDRLGHTPAYLLLPGISLVTANYSAAHHLPEEVVQTLSQGNATALDVFVAARITDYLNSLTLAVKVLDSGTVSNARKLGEEILSGRYSNDLQTGRKKGGGAALWAAGTMAAVGMAALAAVSGKAMMTSMLALMLAAAGALRGNGGGGGDSGKCSSYAYPAAKRSIAVQERPVYRPAYNMAVSPTYGPAMP